MELEENKAIARRFAQVWGKGELDIIDELASPTLSVCYPMFPEVIKGIAAFKLWVTRFRSMFIDADIRIEEEIAEGDKVVLRWSLLATHQGEFPGIPPTGKRIKWTGITVNRIADGKVVEDAFLLICLGCVILTPYYKQKGGDYHSRRTAFLAAN